jgi:hypothetical protein
VETEEDSLMPSLEEFRDELRQHTDVFLSALEQAVNAYALAMEQMGARSEVQALILFDPELCAALAQLEAARVDKALKELVG